MLQSNYQSLVRIGRSLMSERNITKLCELILDEAQDLTCADGGTLYLVDEKHLNFAIVHNNSLNIRLASEPSDSVFPPIPLFESDGNINQHHVAAFTCHAKTLINIEDAYDSQFDFSGAKQFDEINQYRTQSILAIPLLNESNQILGLIQLINAKEPGTDTTCPFPQEIEPLILSLATFAASAIENRTISDGQKALLVELAATNDTQEIIERILDEAISLTHSEGGTLYLTQSDDSGDVSKLKFEIIKNDVLDIQMGGKEGVPIPFPALELFEKDGQPNNHNVAVYSANQKKIINIDDVYESQDFDFSGAQAFDKQTNYRTKSILTFPLLNHQDEIIGVLQLINARHPDNRDHIPFANRYIPLLRGLALYAAIALNNQILVQDLKNLLDAFIKTIAKAIDAKSPHTSGHCQRVPLLMELIAQAACEDESQFQDFQLSDEEWYELRVSAWMHDCGKLATPDSVLDKSTKLHKMRDGIELIEARFSALKQKTESDFLKSVIKNPNNRSVFETEYQNTIESLNKALEFIRTSNKGGEFMSEESKTKINDIAKLTWPDNNGNLQPMLNEDEIYNLCIERGTLTAEERQIINNHMTVTIDMLEGLPFPKQLKRVPEYAGGHHEKMNGTGFPRGLTRDQMSIPARMMAIADIFEALTAKDRPYKDPMKISLSLNIMKRMVEDEHIDPDLFELFVKSRVWKTYAERVLSSEQIDVEDVTPYLLNNAS
ncbi:HD domain-containing phosphohydrolase [Oceaniserpentilla sp. 4NH20-0058]|uniref:HD domain-containing phosphohydrolase n=1 Tax=Oceaniserpentilla sp. 4NH20-0058 TaxID=3127660 RepID=UPI003340BB9F